MRKKPNKLALLVFIPIVVGIGLIIGGSVDDSYAMRMAGVYVLFGGSFAMAVVMTIVTIAIGLRPDKSTDKTKPDGNASTPAVSTDKARNGAAEEAEQPEPEAEQPLEVAPSTERTEEVAEPSQILEEHSSARPKRTKIEYKGIRKNNSE